MRVNKRKMPEIATPLSRLAMTGEWNRSESARMLHAGMRLRAISGLKLLDREQGTVDTGEIDHPVFHSG